MMMMLFFGSFVFYFYVLRVNLIENSLGSHGGSNSGYVYPTQAVLTILALVRPLSLSSSEIATSKVNDWQCVCIVYCLQTVLWTALSIICTEYAVKLAMCTEYAVKLALCTECAVKLTFSVLSTWQ